MKNFKYRYISNHLLLLCTLQVSILFLITPYSSTFADDPLDDMIENNGFDWLKKNKQDVTPKLTSDVDPTSNYARIFKKTKAGLTIINYWLGTPDIDFTYISKSLKYEDSCAQVSRIFQEFATSNKTRKTKGLFIVKTFIPFPAYASAGDTKLIPIMSKLEPPALRVTSEVKKTIAGFDARVFVTETQRCAISIKLPKTSLLYAYIDECDDYEKLRLENLVDSLNLKRLATKLES